MEQNTPPQERKLSQAPTYKATIAAIFFLLFFFPVGLYLMWVKTNWHKSVKLGITGVFGFFTLTFLIGSLTGSKQNSSASLVPSPTTIAQATNTPAPTVPTETPKPTLTPQQIIANFEKEAQTVTVAEIY